MDKELEVIKIMETISGFYTWCVICEEFGTWLYNWFLNFSGCNFLSEWNAYDTWASIPAWNTYTFFGALADWTYIIPLQFKFNPSTNLNWPQRQCNGTKYQNFKKCTRHNPYITLNFKTSLIFLPMLK